jgi:hypothetical protein
MGNLPLRKTASANRDEPDSRRPELSVLVGGDNRTGGQAYWQTKLKNTENQMAIKKGKREKIDTGKDERFAKRDADGTFIESVNVGRSLAADRRSKSKTVAKPGYGDQGDQAKRGKKQSAKKSSKKK